MALSFTAISNKQINVNDENVYVNLNSKNILITVIMVNDRTLGKSPLLRMV